MIILWGGPGRIVRLRGPLPKRRSLTVDDNRARGEKGAPPRRPAVEGNGPRDKLGFTRLDERTVKSERKAYMDKVHRGAKKVQKVVFDLVQQRKQLRHSVRDSLLDFDVEKQRFEEEQAARKAQRRRDLIWAGLVKAQARRDSSRFLSNTRFSRDYNRALPHWSFGMGMGMSDPATPRPRRLDPASGPRQAWARW